MAKDKKDAPQKQTQGVKLNVDETKEFLRHMITNNQFLQGAGKNLVATEIIGESGYGKTSVAMQLKDELSLKHFVKLNLAQIEELGDLVGFPIRQFQMIKDEEKEWVDENMVPDFRHLGYIGTGKNRMSYCPPEWIADKTEGGGILLLDDWNRADVRFIQAVMELIDRQQYISWVLPKNWHILLTANPDDGTYLVNSVDNAQKTRYVSINLKFDVDCWARWAEKSGIDGRCINFLLINPDLIQGNVNARSMTTFFNAISSIKSFEDSLPLVQMIGEGSVGDAVASMFTMFINNRLDKIIAPDKIIHGDEDYVLGALKGIIGKDKTYRADIASTISTRIINYTAHYAENNTISKDITDRLAKIVTSEILTTDICYNTIKMIYNNNPTKFKIMMMNKELTKYIMK